MRFLESRMCQVKGEILDPLRLVGQELGGERGPVEDCKHEEASLL